MNTKKLVIVFLSACSFLLIMSLVSAQGCADEGWKGFAKIGENKTVCLTCTTCDFINITTTNPDSEVFISNQEMEKDGATFCYTFLGEDINSVGTFQTDGYSQLDLPVGFCFDSTLSGKEVSSSAYIIVLIIISLSFLMLIWINIKFNSVEREKLWKNIVTEYFNFNNDKNKSNLAYALFYTLAYALLRMIFVVYYILFLVFIFIFNEFVIAFGINALAVLMPKILVITLRLFILIFIVFIAIFFNIIMDLIKEIEKTMRGIE